MNENSETIETLTAEDSDRLIATIDEEKCCFIDSFGCPVEPCCSPGYACCC